MTWKKYLLLLMVILVFQFSYSQESLNIITFNIRYNTSIDSANSWPFRKDLVAGQIAFHEADLVGVQEALNNQMEDLNQLLKNYASIGVGRKDGNTNGEYAAIFYNTQRLKMLDNATFWLSETPEKTGATGWDAALPRIVTWGLFEDVETGKKFYVFNTHFDHMGKIARKESAKLLMEKVTEIAKNNPAIITGDFNATLKDEPIKLITDKSNPNHFTDSREINKTTHYGPDWTFNNFIINNPDKKRIDFIFIKNGITVLKHATLAEINNGRFTSDHFPVFSTIVLP